MSGYRNYNPHSSEYPPQPVYTKHTIQSGISSPEAQAFTEKVRFLGCLQHIQALSFNIHKEMG